MFADAVLLGGPRDGYQDQVRLPAPELVTVRYCANCRADHVHRVLGYAVDDSCPRYLRSPTDDHDGLLAYRHVDVDDTIERIEDYELAAELCARMGDVGRSLV